MPTTPLPTPAEVALVVADVRESYPELTEAEAVQHAVDTVDPATLDGDDELSDAYRSVLTAAPHHWPFARHEHMWRTNSLGYPECYTCGALQEDVPTG